MKEINKQHTLRVICSDVTGCWLPNTPSNCKNVNRIKHTKW
jgi:hypothetical protein